MPTNNPKRNIPADLRDLVARPPVYRLLGVAEKIHGNHLNHVWKGLAGLPGVDEPSIPVVVKHLPNQGQIDIELACGLASQVMNLPVPRPALVVADVEDLPSRPTSFNTPQVLLFGSLFQTPDPFLAQRTQQDERAAEYIWDQVCGGSVGATGSAWDELVANPDRHAQNLLFDGLKWWLFDHNLALQPISQMYAAISDGSRQSELLRHTARINQLLLEVLKRHPTNHGVEAEASKLMKHAQRLKMLALEMEKWVVQSDRVSHIVKISAVIVNLIALRLEPLSLYLAARLNKPDAETLWNN